MTSASQGATQRARRWTVLPWAVFAIGIPISILLFIVIGHSVDNVARLRFERQASDAKGAIEIRIQFYANVLYGLKALFATQDMVSRVQFHYFINSLDVTNRY